MVIPSNGILTIMSRSKRQTLKSIKDGQSKREIELMFVQKDQDAM